MRDVSLIIMLLLLAWLALRSPWIGLLGLVFVSVMHPQGYAGPLMREFPAYAALTALLSLSAAWQIYRQKAWRTFFWDWRLGLLALLWGQFFVTTWLGINPWIGWPRLFEVSKALPVFVLILLLIDTPQKLKWLMATIALSLSVVMIKGGYWAIIHGFQDRVYGPPGSPYYGNNEFAVASVMVIPLLAGWLLEMHEKWLRWVLAGLIALAFVSALSSWSRGGLLGVIVVAILLAWHSRQWGKAALIAVATIGVVWLVLPGEWFDRMQTLMSPAQEQSASTRLALWQLGWRYIVEHPWFGGGFGSWVYLSLPTGTSLVWHSAYFDMAVEHGLPGFFLWLGVVLGSVASLSRLVWRAGKTGQANLIRWAAMLRASLLGYMVGAAFLSIAYWPLLLMLLACAILVSRLVNAAQRIQPVDAP